MANTITIHLLSHHSETLSMSNQGTDCFLELLLLAASTLKQTQSQRQLISFLQEQKNINEIAPGTAGFDILEDMPWHHASLAEDKAFLLQLICLAKKRHNWNTLEYEPNEEIIFPWLDSFAKMIESVQ